VDKFLKDEIDEFRGHDEIKYELGSEFNEKDFDMLQENSEFLDE
jgi:hypothetical protein